MSYFSRQMRFKIGQVSVSYWQKPIPGCPLQFLDSEFGQNVNAGAVLGEFEGWQHAAIAQRSGAASEFFWSAVDHSQKKRRLFICSNSSTTPRSNFGFWLFLPRLPKNNISYVMAPKHEIPYGWQAQFLKKFHCPKNSRSVGEKIQSFWFLKIERNWAICELSSVEWF